MNRWQKFGLGSAAVMSVVLLGIARYMVYSLTKAERAAVKGNPSDLGLKYKEVSFTSVGGGPILRGWYIAAGKSDRCIIMTHGGRYHRADPTIGMLEIARELVTHGYNVLTFDLRGHGESGEGKMTGGYYERRDLQGAIAYLKEQGILSKNIGLFGFSLGAAASLLAAAEDEALKVVISDSCWADLTDLIQSQIARHRYMPDFLGPVIPRIARAVYGVDINEAKPLPAVDKIAPRPILFIHGEFDNIVPVENALKLYHSSSNPNNKLWIVPEAGHVGSFKACPDEYIAKVIAFFDQAFQ